MDDIFTKYFSGELTDAEKEEFLFSINNNPEIKDEFIEVQNFIGLSGLLPQKGDKEQAQLSLSSFIYQRKVNKKA